MCVLEREGGCGRKCEHKTVLFYSLFDCGWLLTMQGDACLRQLFGGNGLSFGGVVERERVKLGKGGRGGGVGEEKRKEQGMMTQVYLSFRPSLVHEKQSHSLSTPSLFSC